MSRTAIPWGVLGALCGARLVLYVLSAGPLAWGFMSDELYYLACAKRLAWGYVDHPPLSIAVLAAQRAVFGDSLMALRLAPAVMSCATAVLCALLARELGGRRVAQGLAALTAVVFPVYLGVSGFFSMNAIDPVLWAAAAVLLARILNGGDPRLWLVLGAVLGLGLLNKISVLWLGFGIGVGLIATPERRWLATRWPWLAGLVALLVFAPHIVWQIQHDWPTLEFMRRASGEKLVPKSPLAFIAEQLLVTSPLIVPLWIAGLGSLFFSASGRYRMLGWIWVAVFALLMLGETSRPNYIGPAYVALLAAGAVLFERLAERPAWRWLPTAASVAFVLGSAVTAPLALGLLPPERLAAYQRNLGIEVPSGEEGVTSVIPYHLSLRLGWPELLDALEVAHGSLSPEEREDAVVLSDTFGVAGAVEFFGPERSLPPGIAFHNNFWLWGPGDADVGVVIAVHESGDELRKWFADVRRAAVVECAYCSPWLQRIAIWICRDPHRPLREVWPELKKFI